MITSPTPSEGEAMPDDVTLCGHLQKLAFLLREINEPRRADLCGQAAARIAELTRAAAQSSGVRERQRIHDLRVTLSSVVTLAESGGVNLKCLNAIAKASKHSLQRDSALSPDTPREGEK